MRTKKRLLTLAAALFMSLTACEGSLPMGPTLGLETGEVALSLHDPTTVTIDFEDIVSNPDGSTILLATYSKHGFTLSNSEAGFSSPEEDIPTFSRTLFPFPNGATVLERDDEGAFDVVSIDIGEVPWPFFGVTPIEITFTGTKGDASEVEATFTTDGSLGHQTFTFSASFAELVSLSWAQGLFPQLHLFDNIVLSFDDSGPSDPVTSDECKKGGFAQFGFRNQGDCVRFVETGKDRR